ncbi:hypothetical protein [Uliginosibacterium sediminicola]|uniref:Uncharacterized protein n=1 Tax=Uliginosibacterium sediminicola TaxID=2024550 RepID=A0ABU9YVX5_9RHOO
MTNETRPDAANTPPPAESDSRVEFRFIEFNDVRALRGKEAARVGVSEEGGAERWLWMSISDIERNMSEFGRHPELIKARAAYKF